MFLANLGGICSSTLAYGQYVGVTTKTGVKVTEDASVAHSSWHSTNLYIHGLLFGIRCSNRYRSYSVPVFSSQSSAIGSLITKGRHSFRSTTKKCIESITLRRGWLLIKSQSTLIFFAACRTTIWLGEIVKVFVRLISAVTSLISFWTLIPSTEVASLGPSLLNVLTSLYPHPRSVSLATW